MKMEVEYLCEKRRDPGIVATLPQWIDRITAGKLPHCNKVLSALYINLIHPLPFAVQESANLDAEYGWS